MAFREKFLAFNRRVMAAVTKVLLTVGLVFVYALGVSLTWLVLHTLGRRSYALPKAGQDTYWVPAEGYEPTLEDARGQS